MQDKTLSIKLPTTVPMKVAENIDLPLALSVKIKRFVPEPVKPPYNHKRISVPIAGATKARIKPIETPATARNQRNLVAVVAVPAA